MAQTQAEQHGMPGNPLDGQVAIVTGAGSGIGRATCMALAEAGAALVVVDLNAAGVQATVDQVATIIHPDKVVGLTVDVRSERDLDEMVKQATSRLGRIDILVHAAGILHIKDSGPRVLAEVSPEEMHAIIDTNLKGTFLCNRAVVAEMIRQGSGQIVNVSSTYGLKGRAFDSVYCASKFGVIGLTESLAEEVRQFGIRVQAILPDAVKTPLWDQNGPIRAPDDALAPERVAEIIRYMVTLPKDVILENVVVMPFRTRRRKTRPAP